MTLSGAGVRIAVALVAAATATGCAAGRSMTAPAAANQPAPDAARHAATAGRTAIPAAIAPPAVAAHPVAGSRVETKHSTQRVEQVAGSRERAASSLLLTRDALGRDWDELKGREDSASSPHQYCAQTFASDRAIRDRAYGELVRHTDGLRVQQEILRYDGDGAARALADFDAALHCGRYSMGSGPDRLDIEAMPRAWILSGADARVSGDITFSKGSIVLHSRLVIFRLGCVLNVLSVAFQDEAVLDEEAPSLATTALRVSGWRHP